MFRVFGRQSQNTDIGHGNGDQTANVGDGTEHRDKDTNKCDGRENGKFRVHVCWEQGWYILVVVDILNDVCGAGPHHSLGHLLGHCSPLLYTLSAYSGTVVLR